MSDSPFLVGLLNLLLVALLGALVWLVAWALFGDRDWKRPRCPRCHHDLRGSTGLQCPECGFTARSTRELHRRRRRWMVAIAALVALFSLAVLLRSVWSRTSWTSAVPNRVALWLLPRTGSADTGDDLADALGDRLARGELSDGEIEDLLALLLEGDSRAPIGSIAWVGKYGPLVDRWMNVGRRHFLEAAPTPERQAISDAFDRGLERLPPTVGTALPTRWLAGEPLAFELLVERRWNYALPMRVVVESLEFERATAAVRPPVVGPIVLAHGRPVPARIPLLFDPLPAGAHRGTLRVSIETGGESWTPLASVELPVHVPVAEALEGPFDPFHDEALDAAVRDCLTPGLIRWARGSRRFAMRLNPTQELRDRLGDVSLGVEAEILEDGVPRRRLRLWWPADGGVRFEPALEDAEALARARADDSRWTIRVRGVRELALRAALGDSDRARTRWWDGEVSLPLRIRDDDGESMQRPWTVDTPALREGRPVSSAP